MGTLYLVATPIGNLEDITLRALRVLGEVSLIAAEDTRTARKLLSHHGVSARVVSYNEHNMKRRTPELLRSLREGDVALVSEAGMPAISDPGYELVAAVIEAGHEVSPLPGASAVTAAVAASGLAAREFTFAGFLPRRSKARRELFQRLGKGPGAIVFFESPHRVRAALADLGAVLGERRIAVCRELTKLYEEIFRGTAAEALEYFVAPRGEFTVVVEGGSGERREVPEEELRAALRKLRAEGMSARDAAAQVAEETGMAKRRVYALSIEEGDGRPTKGSRAT
ncbi:MAG: 16S rRNA (cytidine(1402)-2'-O)-methyltransferase [Chloroflexi bacterium]|nr:16S rRNA (cytidine(1402)-2'-O)-methyltransferase [Chloroflexota bacterium]